MVGDEHVSMVPSPEGKRWAATVNGRPFEVLAPSNAVLLDVLRDRVGTLGVKRGCDLGTCGCCTVMIDGVPKSLDNMSPFEDQVGACKLALLFELSDELSRQRMAEQGKQEELIQRKLRNFATQTLPIAQALEGRQLLRKISAAEVRQG